MKKRRLKGVTHRMTSILQRASGVAQMRAQLDRIQEIVEADFEGVPYLRTQLTAVRQSRAYELLWKEREPLVSVRIATYNRPDLLVDRAITSVLAQTYERFEIVVVGDGCEPETGRALEKVGDPRVRYTNLPHRGAYPHDPRARWLVAGSHPMNTGAELATGTWLAPLDEDDEMEPDHLEVLIEAALNDRCEVTYGRGMFFQHNGQSVPVSNSPPQRFDFNFGTSVYLRVLRFFEWHPLSWAVNHPGDWWVCKRMLDSGVRFGQVDRVVTLINQTGPREREI